MDDLSELLKAAKAYMKTLKTIKPVRNAGGRPPAKDYSPDLLSAPNDRKLFTVVKHADTKKPL